MFWAIIVIMRSFLLTQGGVKMIKRYFVAMVATAMFLANTSFAETDVSHNWNAEGEAAALAVFKATYESLGGTWKESAFPKTEDSQASTKTRFLGGNPPMAVQGALGGSTADFANAGMSADLSAYAASGNWDDLYTSGIAGSGKHDGKWVSIPVFVDTVNWLFTNKGVLDAAGVSEPTTWNDFVDSLSTLKNAGVIPVAIGGEDWQETVAFDHMILAAGGASFYENVMSGDLDAIGSDAMVQAFANFATIREFTDEGKAGRSWNDTNNLVVSGKAAYIFMGPWATGGYADMEEGKDWSCRLTPWSNTVTALADGFHFIKSGNSADKEAQRLFAAALTDLDTQVKAAAAKGTLPAMKGADPAEFSGCSTKAVDRMNSGETATHWNALSSGLKSALKDTVTAFWNGDMSPAEGRDALLAAVKDI